MLPQSGILYPGGYDPNTVGDIKGRVQRIVIPEKGPVQFQVRSGRETYTVLASPLWHWKDVQKDIAEGTDVRVRGSKALGTDGNLYLIAQEIRNLNTSRSIEFRDEEGYPSWAGPKASAGKAGFGSPMRGGGSLRGPGGIGRGRR